MRDHIAAILAGGKSSRMGFDKAAATFRGERLIDCVVRRLRPQADRLIISGASSYGLEFENVPDAPDAPPGPAAGVFSLARRLARERGATSFVTAPVDGPFLPADLVVRLLDAECAVASDGENLHPTFACWSSERLEAAATAFERDGSPSLMRLAELTGARRVVWADASVFENVNTPEDLRRLDAAAER